MLEDSVSFFSPLFDTFGRAFVFILNTVTLPSVEFPETRSYSASASRTLQRRRHIVMQIKSGELDLHGNASRPLGSESVHRVSAASSVEDLAGEDRAEEFVDSEDFQAELARMEHDAVFSQQL